MKKVISYTDMIEHVSIDEVNKGMSDIAFGMREPSLKLAFWAAALSAGVRLHVNCMHVRSLAPYVETGLPDKATLLQAMGARDGKMPVTLTHRHIDALYRIEQLCDSGTLVPPDDWELETQQAWRNSIVPLICGMAMKTVSWALFIYNPFKCQLLTLDVHHCDRLGVKQSTIAGSSAAKINAYLALEKQCVLESMRLYPEFPPVIVQAWLWTNVRIAKGANATKVKDSCESHKGLSCRWY